eukprot:TRINITY_DN25170_c0_g1_i1.p1 TRINITY_DN25170_c0_g1~~TRINITY_DN25170_c0_g1_i1.p1  ORF type:complete len:367 (+),score=95.53 TRINITY_DN25170_c0_g1_i1:107-1102(+)
MGGCSCMPSKEETIKLLKQLVSSALGMVGALAMNEALKMSFSDMAEDAGVAMYAIIISWISIFVLGIIKLNIKDRAERCGGEKAAAICDLFKVCFCLLSASAWQAVFELSTDEWEVFGIAIGLTIGLVVIIIIVFECMECYKTRGHPKCHPAPGCFCMTHMVGLCMWTPITFGLVAGVVWNEFFQMLIKGNMGEGSAKVMAFVYAAITVPLAIAIILYTERVEEKGWGCCSCQCPGRMGRPCCEMRNEVSEALVSMFTGEASALMAFAWNGAFEALWEGTEASSAPADIAQAKIDGSINDPPNIGILIAYAIVAIIVAILAVLLVKRCTKA